MANQRQVGGRKNRLGTALVGSVVLGVGLLAIYLKTKGSPLDAQNGVAPPSEEALSSPAGGSRSDEVHAPGGAPQAQGATGASSTDEPIVLPDRDQIRNEVSQNPHVTPPSLLQFARALAPRMKEALSSDDPQVLGRMTFFLKGCAISDSPQAVVQVQAQCLKNLGRLAASRQAVYPPVRLAWEEAQAKASEDAKRIVRSMEQLQDYQPQ